jgi:orotate phosphoribosyltransferase
MFLTRENEMNVTEYCDTRDHLAREMIKVGVIVTADSDHPRVIERDGIRGKERGFKLKLHDKNPNAPLSPFYLDLGTKDNPKPGPLTQEIVNLATRCMQYAYFFNNNIDFDAVVGIPNAGDPFAKAWGKLYGVHRLELEKYEYNDKRAIASLKLPIPLEVKKVLLVDDLITEADSKRESIDVLRDNSLEVIDVVVLVDREQGGENELRKLGCALHSVFTITALLDLFFVMHDTNKELRNKIRSYLKN